MLKEYHFILGIVFVCFWFCCAFFPVLYCFKFEPHKLANTSPKLLRQADCHQNSLGRKNYFRTDLKGTYAIKFLIDSYAALGMTGTTGGCFLEIPQGFNKWNKWAMGNEVSWKSAWLTL